MLGIKVNTKKPVTLVAIAWCVFQLYTGFFGVLSPMRQRPIHLCFAMVLTYLCKPLSKKLDPDRLYLDQIAAVLLSVGCAGYLYAHHLALDLNIGFYTPLEVVIGAVLLVLVLEAARRLTGWGLVATAGVFLLYCRFGSLMPGAIRHPGASWSKIATFMSMNTQSILGTCIDCCATFIFLFILYARLLESTGGGQVFIDLALSLVGHVRGGPAKVAVLGSSLFGSISGSAVANVVGTGTFTIPLMKKTGYDSYYAGAVEAVSSSGGQFMPPIMGASAFLIAEILSMAYWKVALYAAVPAVLYYAALFIMTDLEAGKKNLLGVPKETLPRTKEVFKQGWPCLVSPLVLVYLLAFLQWSPAKSCVWAIAVTFLISMLHKPSRLSPSGIAETMESGARGALETSIACAAVGVVVGSVTLTGLALKLSGVLISLSQGNILVLLILTMVACVVMGMGLPTVACYIVLAAMIAPALIQSGIAPIAAHLFIFYFGIISAITPPVALASYVAAGIAQADFVKTSAQALKLGSSAFILPFMFAFNPALVLQGEPLQILQCIVTALVGIFSLSVTMEGYFLTRTPLVQRALFAAAAATLIVPESYTDIIGLALFAVVTLRHIRYAKKPAPAPAA